MIVDAVGRTGRLLDIGCGSGQLLIRCAKASPGEYYGLDRWGEDWEYSRAQAERNAVLEGVPELHFVQGSASCLPFDDGQMQRVVSCLTFHEVRDVEDKTVGITEALRVLAAGGTFVFLDLFDDPRSYPGREHVLETIERAGGEIESARALPELLELRFPLGLGKVLGHAVLVAGTKRRAT